MRIEPKIETLKETMLIGKRITMSFAQNKTSALWQNFMPQRKKIKNTISPDLYSIEIYPNTAFFENFNPTNKFEKWAAMAVENFDSVPEDMDKIVLPEGKYAVFHYKGRPEEAQETFQYIYGIWLPNSNYEMDDRPYFALMGEKYKGNSPDSEEEFWIPVKVK